MTVRLPSYLHRNRHGIFGFRFIVPRSLQIYFEAKQYRFSLRTADKKRAKRLALMLASLASNYLSRIQQMTEHRAKAATAHDLIAAFNELLDEQVAPPTDLVESITSLGTSELDAFVKAVCAEMPENDIRLSIAEHIVTLKKRADAYKTEHQSIAAMVVSEANAKMKVFEDDEAWDALQSRMASSIAEHAALMEEFAALKKAAAGLQRQLLFDDALAAQAALHDTKIADAAKFAAQMMASASMSAVPPLTSPSAPSPVNTARTPAQKPQVMLSAVVDAYCGNRLAEQSWSEKTEAENRAIYALWLEIVGDQPIASYGYEQHRDYKMHLMKLPANINKKPSCRGKSIEQIIAMKLEPMNVTTANKNLSRLGSLFRWAVAHGYTTLNPASSMAIPTQRSAREQRDVFSETDLCALFNTNEYAKGRHASSYMHWIPLIGLYSGARINEIAQLHLDDFVEIDAIPMISFNSDGVQKRIKTRAGVRQIPVHPELIRLGLMTHVSQLRENRSERLFPELTSGRDGYGQIPSKWFARYKKRVEVTDARKVFHSFRHTFVTRLMQAEVPKERIAALVGHEDDSETFGRYGKSFSVSTLLSDISRIPNTHTQRVFVAPTFGKTKIEKRSGVRKINKPNV